MTKKPTNDNHLIARNDALDEKIEKHTDVAKDIQTLFAIGKRNRRLIKLLYVSVVFEVVLMMIVAFFAGQVIINKGRVDSNHAALVTSCNSGNEFRKDNLALWTYILATPARQPQTDAQKKLATNFSQFVKSTFALRDCTGIE